MSGIMRLRCLFDYDDVDSDVTKRLNRVLKTYPCDKYSYGESFVPFSSTNFVVSDRCKFVLIDADSPVLIKIYNQDNVLQFSTSSDFFVMKSSTDYAVRLDNSSLSNVKFRYVISDVVI